MIRSFGDQRTEGIFNGLQIEGADIDTKTLKRIERKLTFIDSASKIYDLRASAPKKLQKMEGNLKAFHTSPVNRRYSIMFKWKHGDAYEVRLTDENKQ